MVWQIVLKITTPIYINSFIQFYSVYSTNSWFANGTPVGNHCFTDMRTHEWGLHRLNQRFLALFQSAEHLRSNTTLIQRLKA